MRKDKGIISIYKRNCMWFLVLFWCINSIQLPLYTNYVTEGKIIQSDSIKIAEYLNENNYEMVYYMVGDKKESNDYVRNFYGYLRQPFVIVDKEEDLNSLQENRKEKSAVLTHKGYQFGEYAVEKLNLETEKLDLYLLLEEYIYDE